jgi:intein/homing endonuclease
MEEQSEWILLKRNKMVVEEEIEEGLEEEEEEEVDSEEGEEIEVEGEDLVEEQEEEEEDSLMLISLLDMEILMASKDRKKNYDLILNLLFL